MLYHSKDNTYRDKEGYLESKLRITEEEEIILQSNQVKIYHFTLDSIKYLSEHQSDYVKALNTLKEGIDYVIEKQEIKFELKPLTWRDVNTQSFNEHLRKRKNRRKLK